MCPTVDGEPVDVSRLAASLRALASPVRLEVLFSVREPQSAAEILVKAGSERAALRAERALSRSTIEHHLGVLEEEALVTRQGGEGRFVVNRQRIFALLTDLSPLARLEASVDVDVGLTTPAGGRRARSQPVEGPRLVVVGGPRGDVAFGLAGPGPWWLGRDPAADVPLDHDPHVSRRHVQLARSGQGYVATAEPAARNPAWLDGALLAPGEPQRLDAGALLAVGASRLVFRPH